MRAFSPIGHFIPDSTDAPSFWPGDDIEVSVLASEEYKQVSKKRMEKLRDVVFEQTRVLSYNVMGCVYVWCYNAMASTKREGPDLRIPIQKLH